MDEKQFLAIVNEVGLTEDELYTWLAEGKRKAQVAQIREELRVITDQKNAEIQAVLAEPIARE